MELPQPRAFGTEGRKATHDFLSLCSSTVQQDQSSPQGGYLKTHDFLQPLERVGNNVTKEENKVRVNAVEKPPPAHVPTSVEHLLPGGIGTYSISYFNQKVLKPEGSLFAAEGSNNATMDENSNCSSYTGNGFALWDESAVKKGKTGKENIATERHFQKAGMNVVGGQWPSMLEKPSQSSSNHRHKNSTFGSFSSSQLSSSQKNQTFMDMITSVKNDQEEDDDDEEEEFIVKKETSSHPKVKIEARTIDQKPSTPRSKHSATEQRRRSKINDRFHKLREIIPNSDQKRDKASLLLEVIEYIQFLQEKVHKYESSYTTWNPEPSKMMQQRNCRAEDGFIDHSRVMNSESGLFAANFDENKAGVSPAVPINGQHLVESDVSTATTSKGRGQQPELTSKPAPIHPAMEPNFLTFGRASIAASPVSPKEASDMDKTTPWPPSHFLQNRSCTSPNDKLKDPELSIESGTINISSVYSQGLLNTLTHALQSSGLDLTQASISVQIDLGKRANGTLNSSASTVKHSNVATTLPGSRVAGTEEFDKKTLKRPRTS